MSSRITEGQVRELAARAKPFNVVLHWRRPEQYVEGAEAIELALQRRILSSRADLRQSVQHQSPVDEPRRALP